MSKQNVDDAQIGRFDQSFLIHMIKDFFVILLVVSILEFGLKAALVYYDYRANGAQRVQMAAAEIAENVRSIMLNEGGPVAARTLYPILDKNWSERGYTIAIEPSEVTIESIRESFDYTPEGIPFPTNSVDGNSLVHSLDIKAQDFCVSCHTQAKVGDVLGTVKVRSYLKTYFGAWWSGVQLTLGLAVGKIVLHSILLFILLRSRLEPLLRLRAVVSNLARAFGGLDQRAEVKSPDEFGALARDLNLFLDRVGRLVAELDTILRDVVEVNDDILKIQSDLRGQVDGMVSETRALERRALIGAKREPKLSNDWFAAIKRSVGDLDAVLAQAPKSVGLDAAQTLASLETVIGHAEAQVASNEALFEDLADLGHQTEEFQTAMTEMIRLEERMKSIVETGTMLVRRLQTTPASE